MPYTGSTQRRTRQIMCGVVRREKWVWRGARVRTVPGTRQQHIRISILLPISAATCLHFRMLLARRDTIKNLVIWLSHCVQRFLTEPYWCNTLANEAHDALSPQTHTNFGGAKQVAPSCYEKFHLTCRTFWVRVLRTRSSYDTNKHPSRELPHNSRIQSSRPNRRVESQHTPYLPANTLTICSDTAGHF